MNGHCSSSASESEGRCFEFRYDCDKFSGTIAEVGSGDPPMASDSVVELLTMWADLKGTFGIPLSEEECEFIETFELPSPGEEADGEA